MNIDEHDEDGELDGEAATYRPYAIVHNLLKDDAQELPEVCQYGRASEDLSALETSPAAEKQVLVRRQKRL